MHYVKGIGDTTLIVILDNSHVVVEKEDIVILPD